MNDSLHVTLGGWANFYLLTGTAAAALTGLQFVVQTLLTSNMRPVHHADAADGIGAFGTPTVVHFALALIISAVACVPWPGYGALRAVLSVFSVGALGYSAIVVRRALRQQSYVPTAYDWFWHNLLPAVAYAAMLVAAAMLGEGTTWPFFVIGAATLLLLCVGIHNAWDTVTYLTITVLRDARER